MPIRSLNSSVLKWPNKETVVEAMKALARKEFARRPDLLRLGFFGSYAKGNWGVGSDLDLVAVIRNEDDNGQLPGLPAFIQRPLTWDLSELPVPAEILIYTEKEWEEVVNRQDRFAQVMSTEVVWCE